MKRPGSFGCSVLFAFGSLAGSPAYSESGDLALTFRTHYGQVDRHFGPEDSEEASFTTKVDYTSAYYGGFLGFDASVYSVSKLYADKNTAGLPLLDDDGNGFSKIGQANIKIRPVDDLEFRLGRMRVISPLLIDTAGRSEPSTREAFKMDAQLGSASLYGIYSTAVSRAGNDSFESYTEDDDGVAIVGGKYRFDDALSVHLAHGQLKDAKRQTYFNASYGIPLGEDRLSFDLHHYMAKGIGDQSNLADATGPDGQLDTYLSSLAVSYAHEDVTYSVSYQGVGDDLYEPSWDGFENDRSVLWTNNSVQILDFYNPQQESLQFRVDYAPSLVPGLSLMTRYTEGDYSSAGETLEDKEFNLEAMYEVQQGWAKGLSFQLRYADVTIGGVGELEDVRLIAQYALDF
ncbi:hypothetical protein CVH10_05790 [Halomonas sp. ND22Bw]|uniref:OprD family outer membrane porin n=1 Tax=Halomonas sp. ND22Bw TaxID=2054178 RepID=UPI000D0ACD41|nr:hypothetical protein CVH10_05790 [Halomonas sp. ND22Bw]